MCGIPSQYSCCQARCCIAAAEWMWTLRLAAPDCHREAAPPGPGAESGVVLKTIHRFQNRFSQSQRRPLLRHCKDTMLNRHWPCSKQTWNWDTDPKVIRDWNLPVVYDNCVGVPISRLLTGGLTPVYHSVLNVKAFNQEKGPSPWLYNIAVSSFAALARSLHMPLSRAPPSLSRDLDTGGCAHSVYRDTLPGSDAGSAAGHSVQCPSLL